LHAITEDGKETIHDQGETENAMVQPGSDFKILVVDDSPVYRKLIEHVLSPQSCRVLYATDGNQALRLYQDESPCLVITDWMMPDVSGVDLCGQIRSDRSRPYTYIILMTGKSEKANVVKGFQAGADDYITKPFDEAEMLARVGVGRRIVELNRELTYKSQKLKEAALTDALTDLPNRRALEDWASKQLLGAARHNFQVWFVLCDIDSFKAINDTFGHEAGDSVLREFAGILKKNVRASDLCGRLGGDEFLLVITHVTAEGIELATNRVREKFAAFSFPFAGKSISTTATFGVAGAQGRQVQDFRILLQAADKMLYEAKRNGRNCTRVLKSDEMALTQNR
jgi:two-component system, cell cycle response regulator